MLYKHIKTFSRLMMSTQKRSLENSAPRAKKPKLKRFRPKPVDLVGNEGVLRHDIADLLKANNIEAKNALNDMNAFVNRDRSTEWPWHKEVELEIQTLSSNGSGLALYESRPVVVPYTLPGDKVLAKIYRTEEYYFEAEIRDILVKSPERDDSLINCKYFAKCSGCQLQMTSYENQLNIKRNTVISAYKHFAPKLWVSGKLPEIHPTYASPKQYNYRTKLTPHFDIPKKGLTEPPPIGFGVKGRTTVLDIEECAIATPVVNQGLTEERAKIIGDYKKYKRGVTLLLRQGEENDKLVCVTNPKEIMTETIDSKYSFKFKAGTFFQNNNSILPIVTEFVRNNIAINGNPPKYLVDTYCGCGLFAITCSSGAESVVGVEISAESVEFAEENAKLNNIKNAKFVVGEAEKIFEHVSTAPEETAIVIDPPRKGCDQKFLDQLVEFLPAKVVYVSCNVHSQARDLEYLLERTPYKVESLGGFDFFPQTHHVEGVAVLSR